MSAYERRQRTENLAHAMASGFDWRAHADTPATDIGKIIANAARAAVLELDDYHEHDAAADRAVVLKSARDAKDKARAAQRRRDAA